MIELYNKLEKLASSLNEENELLILAEDNQEATDVIANMIIKVQAAVNEAKEKVKPSDDLSIDDLKVIAEFASELDSDESPEMQKIASVLDQILLTLAVPEGAEEAKKQAEAKNIEKIKSEIKDKYNVHKANTALAKEIANTIKKYKPMEHPLSTRTCPDHPGIGIARVAEDTYQCSLDKKVYNYKEGFTLYSGSKVPGTDAANQTHMLDNYIDNVSFATREKRNSE